MTVSMRRATGPYIGLFLLLTPAVVNQAGNTWNAVYLIAQGDTVSDQPFLIQNATRSISSGPLAGDQILAIDGKPFHSYRQYLDAIRSAHPGNRLRLTLSEPSGEAVERIVEIPSRAADYQGAAKIAIAICFDVVIPVVALLLGAAAVFIRPRDMNAWLLLFLMISFTESARYHRWIAPGADATFLWSAVWTFSWPIWMLLFGIRFPERPLLDRLKPWLKYLIIAPAALAGVVYTVIILIWIHDLNQAARLQPVWEDIAIFNRILDIAGISGFFAAIGYKLRTEQNADSRRRLRTLMAGASVSLTPIFLLVIYWLATGQDIFAAGPWEVTATAAFFLAIFPLTLVYVIVVDRAMDLGFVIRQSVQYGVVRAGLWLARAALVVTAVFVFQAAASRKGSRATEPLELTAVGVGLLLLRRRASERVSAWVDRKFFREAYDAEHVLSDLAREVAGYVEIDPLLRKVAERISTTLHVPEMVVLLREGDRFVARYSTRPGEPMDIAADSRIVRHIRERGEAAEVVLEKPAPWLRHLSAEDLQTLDYMRTQLLLPLGDKERLSGIMSLGGKLSEAPYTPTDIRLLEAVASQMSLAVHNSLLAASLASEAAARERTTREIEIAREVQERLFPQQIPSVGGLDSMGYCRPARGVGGDYYDFLPQPGGNLGLAIGDVSGKGIAAALLMASLQASLRGQALAGVHDLPTLMNNVNRLVYDASTSNRYATFFYGVYESETRRLSYVNGGHNPPFIIRGDQVVRLEATGPVVGLLPRVHYESGLCDLQPGDIFIGFTDGISEAQNEFEEEWEEERFLAAIRACEALPARQMIDSIFRAADAFTGSAPQFDDMTLLIIKLDSHPLK